MLFPLEGKKKPKGAFIKRVFGPLGTQFAALSEEVLEKMGIPGNQKKEKRQHIDRGAEDMGYAEGECGPAELKSIVSGERRGVQSLCRCGRS